MRLALLLLLAAGCVPPPPPPPMHAREQPVSEPSELAPPASAPTPADAPEPEAAPVAEPSFTELPLERGEPAVLFVPGGKDKKPVLVATHGAGGRAINHCRLWQDIVGQRAFIVCPRGFPMGGGDGYFYDGHPKLAVEVGMALEALAERYGDRVDLERPLYAGYSQGAGMGSMMLPEHQARFAAAILMEGGFGEYQEWNVASARRFRQRGATKVLFACGRKKCFDMATTTAGYMKRAGLEVKVLYEDVGHSYGGALHERVREAFEWLVEGDPRW